MNHTHSQTQSHWRESTPALLSSKAFALADQGFDDLAASNQPFTASCRSRLFCNEGHDLVQQHGPLVGLILWRELVSQFRAGQEMVPLMTDIVERDLDHFQE